MTLLEACGTGLVWVGVFFFVTAAAGLLRFPDTLTRLHALAKSDNPALGCVAVGLALMQPDLFAAGKVILVWIVTLFASATSGFDLARHIRSRQAVAEGEEC